MCDVCRLGVAPTKDPKDFKNPKDLINRWQTNKKLLPLFVIKGELRAAVRG